MTITDDAKNEITTAFIKASHPGATGEQYYTDGIDVWEVSPTAAWNPWPDNTEVVNVKRLFDYAEIGVDQSAYENEEAEENTALFFLSYLADTYEVDDEGFATPADVA